MIMQHLVLSQALQRAERKRPDLAGRIVSWGHDMWNHYKTARRYRRTVRTLHGLDDRTLHDIGVHRSEIESYAAVGGAGRFPDRYVADHGFPRG
jgi:uncharacterized protein YjiS (DUF1127 family)